MRCASLVPLGLLRWSHCSSPCSVLPSILPPSYPTPGLASGTVPGLAVGMVPGLAVGPVPGLAVGPVPGLAAGLVPCSTPGPITWGGLNV